MMRRRLSALLASLLVLSTAGAALAFNTLSFEGRNTVRWRDSAFPVSYEVQSNFGATPGSDDNDAIAAAVSTWEAVGCAGVDLSFDGYTAGNALTARDDRNRIVYTTQGFRSSSSGAVGVTYTEFSGDAYGWSISGGDIAINAYTNWSTNPGFDEMDVESVVLHELGHLLGLQHTPILAATMYFATGPGDVSQRSLHADDVAGACYLYPSGRFNCTDNSDCPTLESNDTDSFGNPVVWGRATCQSDGSCALAGAPPGDPIGSTCAGPADCESSVCVPSPSEENNVCTEACTEGNDDTCPGGFTCLSYPDEFGDVCVAQGDGALGEACEGGLDCSSTVCVGISETEAVCSEICSPGTIGACPPGSACFETDTAGEGFCLAGGDTPFGDPCSSSIDCEGVVCLIFEVDSDEGLCTQSCNPNNPADACPDGAACWPGSAEDEFFCVPGGDDPAGTACDSNLDCQDALCVPYDNSDSNFRCGQSCEFRAGVNECPDGFVCFPLEVDGVCLPQGDGALGATCEAIFDCESLLCLADDDVCTEFCTSSCPDGFECAALTGGLGGCVADGTIPGGDTGRPDGGGNLPDGGGNLPDSGSDDDRPDYAPDAGSPDGGGTGGGSAGGSPAGDDGGCATAPRGGGASGWWLISLLALAPWKRARRPRSASTR